ncbi:hypothetical protein BXZ70DRAFT_909920 [Cristinia sonorae]|uniref:Uncharacterized protein n=1 Tax=Cristinia sonorae TaxID=1940300 RepID=A0A8K0UGS1_9AGAR|nr:hypothetical protein BXZ70DRAFT_909920 [Cristinia sonorae]
MAQTRPGNADGPRVVDGGRGRGQRRRTGFWTKVATWRQAEAALLSSTLTTLTISQPSMTPYHKRTPSRNVPQKQHWNTSVPTGSTFEDMFSIAGSDRRYGLSIGQAQPTRRCTLGHNIVAVVRSESPLSFQILSVSPGKPQTTYFPSYHLPHQFHRNHATAPLHRSAKTNSKMSECTTALIMDGLNQAGEDETLRSNNLFITAVWMPGVRIFGDLRSPVLLWALREGSFSMKSLPLRLWELFTLGRIEKRRGVVLDGKTGSATLEEWLNASWPGSRVLSV